MALMERDLIVMATKDFQSKFHSSLPLRHFRQFYNETHLRSVAELEMKNSVKKFKDEFPNEFQANGPAIETELSLEIEKIVEEYVAKNEDHKSQSESFYYQEIEVLCQNFKTSSEGYLLMNPEMDLKSFEELLEKGKTSVTSYFQHSWYHENIDFFEERRQNLKDQLDQLGKELLETQDRHLAQEKVRIDVENVKSLVLEQSRHLKEYVEVFHGKVSTVTSTKSAMIVPEVSRQMVHNIRHNLESKGQVFKTQFPKLYWAVIGTLEDAVKYMPTTEDLVGWARKLHFQLNYVCSKNETEFDSKLQEEENRFGLRNNESFQPETNQNNNHDDEEIMNMDEARSPVETMRIEEENATSHVEVGMGIKRRYQDQDASEELGSIIISPVVSMSRQTGPPDSVQEDEEPPMNSDGDSATPPIPKRLKQIFPENMQPEPEDATGTNANCESSDSGPSLNVPDEDGDYPLLLAIQEGESVEEIQKLLNLGANVNIKSDDEFKDNAAHDVFWALVNEQEMNTERALDILNLLVRNRFKLINEKNGNGLTPLHYAMSVKDLDEKLLQWFYDNGADFNVLTDENGDSVLMQAIFKRQSAGNLRKILEFGGNPKIVNKYKQNVIHRSAMYAHQSALEMVIDEMDLDEVDQYHCTPLHYLFTEEDLDYQGCLEFLLGKGANFCVKNEHGLIPLVNWIKYSGQNPFPVLMNMKNQLPISHEIASSALTFIVTEFDKSLRAFIRMPSSDGGPVNEFVHFIIFLILEKKAKLILKDNCNWIDQTWEVLNGTILSPEFLKELRTRTITSRNMKWNDKINRIQASAIGKLDFCTGRQKKVIVTVPIETVIVCLLASGKYENFDTVSGALEKLCLSVELPSSYN